MKNRKPKSSQQQQQQQQEHQPQQPRTTAPQDKQHGSTAKKTIDSNEPTPEWFELPAGGATATGAVFLITLVVYTLTAPPSVTGGDSGELIITTCNLGVAHPPGYPIYTMLGRLSHSLLPWGHKAWRVNMCSAFLGSFAAAFAYATTATITHSIFPGLVTGFGFAFSHTVWLYSIQGEVFALNNLFTSLMLYLALLFYSSLQKYHHHFIRLGNSNSGAKNNNVPRNNNDADNNNNGDNKKSFIQPQTVAVLGALVCGLSMANQHTSVFYVAINCLCITWVLFVHSLLTFRLIAALSAALLSGFVLPYLYIVHSAFHKRMDSWGDQRTVQGFLHHFLRREYGTFQLAADNTTNDPGMIARLLVYARVLAEESLYITPALAAIGILALVLFRDKSPIAATAGKGTLSTRPINVLRRVGEVYFFSYLLYVIVFHKLANLDLAPLFLGVQARFWQQPNLNIFIWAGVGLNFIVSKVTALACGGQNNNNNNNNNNNGMKSALLGALSIGFAVTQLVANYPSKDYHADNVFYNQGVYVLNSFPQNSLVLLNGDLNNNIIKYPQQCEGVRPDLRLLSVQLMTWEWFVPMQAENYPGVKFPGHRYHPRVAGGFSLKGFLDANYKKFRGKIFLCGPFKEGDPSYQGHYQDIPYGLCAKLVKNKDAPGSKGGEPWSAILNASYSALPSTSTLGGWFPHKYTPETWEYVAMFDLWRRQLFLSSYISLQSNKIDKSNADYFSVLKVAKRAMDEIFDGVNETLLESHGMVHTEHYRGAGVIYGQYSVQIEHDPSQRKEFKRCEQQLLRLWGLVQIKDPTNKELVPYVSQRINPYTNKPIKP